MKKEEEKEPELTPEEVEKLLERAGFTFVIKPQSKKAFGKPDSQLHKGDTVIYPEGSKRGIVIKGNG